MQRAPARVPGSELAHAPWHDHELTRTPTGRKPHIVGIVGSRAHAQDLGTDSCHCEVYTMTTQPQTAAPALSGSQIRPAVEDGRPPALVLRFVNPIIRAILRSPVHRPLSRQLMLLSMRGRRTGRWVTVPVGRHEVNRTLLVSVSGRWRHNLRDGAPVRVTLDGRERVGYAEVIDDPDEVAQTFKMLIDRLGPGGAGLLGMKLNIRRLPTVDEIRPVVAPRWIARVRLTDEPARGVAS